MFAVDSRSNLCAGESAELASATQATLKVFCDGFDSWVLAFASPSARELKDFPLPATVTCVSAVALFHVSGDRLWKCIDFDSR